MSSTQEQMLKEMLEKQKSGGLKPADRYNIPAQEMPAQDPQPGQAISSSSASSCMLIVPAVTLPTASNTLITSALAPLKRPDIMGPPLITIAGIFKAH